MIERKELTKRFGQIDPMSIEDAIAHGDYDIWNQITKWSPLDILNDIQTARLTGRGGAGFLTSIKMKSFAKQERPKYIVCNADEGEPGNFKDRYLMEKDPHQIIEGMLVAAYATDADKGYIYIRGEYNKSIQTMKQAIQDAKKQGLLQIPGREDPFTILVRRGAGAYVCGEEFALIESIEGKPGRTRVKPPYPAEAGIFQVPTLINNVETFCNLPFILRIGGKAYKDIGNEHVTGTKLISLSGNVKHKGLYEVPYGTTIRQVIKELGGGTIGNRSIKMVQLGGACGAIIPEELLDMDIDNERFQIFDSKMGAGAIIVMDDSNDLFDILLKNMQFFAHESCGKCTPCREGHIQLVRLLRRFVDRVATQRDMDSLQSLASVIHDTTLCGLGQTSPTSILSTMEFFPEEYNRRIAYRKRGEYR
jgi:NADH-quinone oxidoreductase subunit F